MIARQSTIGALALLFSCALLSPPTLAQTDATLSLEERARVLREQETTLRTELADEAKKLGLLRDAVVLAQQVLAVAPDHPIRQLAADIAAIRGEEFASTYTEALSKHGRSFAKRMEDALEPIAEAVIELAELAADTQPELAESFWTWAYDLTPDSGKVAKELRKLDYDAIFNYGVLPEEEKKQARRVLGRLGGAFLTRRFLEDELEFWTDAWGLGTRHYKFVTNAPHQTVFAFAEECENLYDAWDEFMRSLGAKMRTRREPMTIYLFASTIDYETIPRITGETPWSSDEVLGYYSPGTKIGYFYDSPEFYAGDLTLLFETFYHEGAHQLFDLRLRADWRGNLATHALNWVEEGICCYFETLTVEGEGRKRKFEFGGLMDDDFLGGAEGIIAGQLLPASEFIHCDSNVWNSYGPSYPHAALVSHYLFEADGGRYRKFALETLIAERQHNGFKRKSFFEQIGMTSEQFDEALLEFAKKAKAELPIREYKD